MNEELKAGFETGNLRLVRRIGAGGMGTVWLAEHLTLRTRVAVKFLTDPALYSDAIGLERFAREAEVLARIKSPYIVQVLDRAMTNSGVPYLVLELLEGETLSKHIARNGGASLEVTRRVVEHVGKALAKAHALGVVHRDVKPDNIYLATADDGLVCKVFDFGVAKEHGGGAGDPLTGSGSMVGTPSYMSPEQFADSGVVDHHVDLWSLAVVAYIALTGSRPFTGSDLVELCRNVLRGRYIPPSQREGARVDPVPGRVDAWFQRAFAPHRAQRFSSATEMVDAFLDALGDVGSGEPLSDELADMLLASSLPGLPEPARSSGA
ncbi:MAG: serine/threonine protein kinase, partial [Deltaproteobacteria bacterium]|nr:serine/threonine protein kinase [Deltaproteobacteria bacterium]